MRYKEVAGEVLKEYAMYMVENKYKLDTYKAYQDVFNDVFSYVFGITDTTFYPDIAKGYKKRLHKCKLYPRAKQNREAIYTMTSVLFNDVVIKELEKK